MGRLKLKPIRRAPKLTERRRTAIHEAGHAVVSAALGIQARVDILKSSDGVAAFSGGHRPLGPRTLDQELAICFGGFVAERMAGVPEKEAKLAAAHDYDHAEQVVALYANGDRTRVATGLEHALSILNDEAKWDLINRVAWALLDHECVVVSADGMVAPDDPQVARAYWERPEKLTLLDVPEPSNDNASVESDGAV